MYKQLILEIPEFPTHVLIGTRKSDGKETWKKISGNSIYAGMHHSIRNKMFDQMHDFLLKHIPDGYNLVTPIEVGVTFYVPINYGDVRFISKTKEVSWRIPPEDYVARWDIDNLAWPWIKALLDTLTKKFIIPDDTVEQIHSVHYKFIPCETLAERKTLNVVDKKISRAS